MDKYKVQIDGVDFSHMVERDSYSTALEIVYSASVQTMDGITHTAPIRTRGSLSLGFNPQTSEDTRALCTALLKSPVEVLYYCLQRGEEVYATMMIDSVSATYLSRCLAFGQKWNDLQAITLQEL